LSCKFIAQIYPTIHPTILIGPFDSNHLFQRKNSEFECRLPIKLTNHLIKGSTFLCDNFIRQFYTTILYYNFENCRINLSNNLSDLHIYEARPRRRICLERSQSCNKNVTLLLVLFYCLIFIKWFHCDNLITGLFILCFVTVFEYNHVIKTSQDCTKLNTATFKNCHVFVTGFIIACSVS